MTSESVENRNKEIFASYLELKQKQGLRDCKIHLILSEKVWACGNQVMCLTDASIKKIIENMKQTERKVCQS